MGRWVEESIGTLCDQSRLHGKENSPSRPSLDFPELIVASVGLLSKGKLVYLRMEESATEV